MSTPTTKNAAAIPLENGSAGGGTVGPAGIERATAGRVGAGGRAGVGRATEGDVGDVGAPAAGRAGVEGATSTAGGAGGVGGVGTATTSTTSFVTEGNFSVSSAARNSEGVAYRFAGSSANTHASAARIATRCAGVVPVGSVQSCSPVPAGRRPVSNSWASTPNEYTSARMSHGRPATRSGAV